MRAVPPACAGGVFPDFDDRLPLPIPLHPARRRLAALGAGIDAVDPAAPAGAWLGLEQPAMAGAARTGAADAGCGAAGAPGTDADAGTDATPAARQTGAENSAAAPASGSQTRCQAGGAAGGST